MVLWEHQETFTVGHEDVNDFMFTGQIVRWVIDERKRKHYISIDQKLSLSELEEIVLPKRRKDTDLCDKQLHTSYRSSLGSINWLQSALSFRIATAFPGWRRPQLRQLLATARSFISSADRFAMLKLRCVCGLLRVLLRSLVFLMLLLGETATSPFSVLWPSLWLMRE